ncbi:MAG: NIP7 pre-PUA domain-containing protein [Candidatus Hermodarchaeia archaeon]|jgi:ribosome biogenesis protein Nip4
MPNEKTGRLTFVTPTPAEDACIRDGLAVYISNKAVAQLITDSHLVIGKGRRQEVFLLSGNLWNLYQQVQPQHPYFIGLFLGELKGTNFHPSLHVVHRLADAVKPSTKVIALSKGEQRFLYGRPLESQEFQSENPNLDQIQKVLVVNSQQEGLGYGELMKTPSGDVVVKNRLDLGWYLRRGQ